MISKLFKKIQESCETFYPDEKNLQLNNAHTLGQSFEQKIEDTIEDLGYAKWYSKNLDENRFKSIKVETLAKKNTDFIDIKKNENLKYIRQPFGSQEYPDFLIFTERKIIPIEIKYSKTTSPMWNSNLPKANGFYIFGSHESKDITFFCGKNVLSELKRTKMIDFFEEMKQYERKFNKDLKEIRDPHNRGFNVYIRRAYEQKSETKDNNSNAKNYFMHKERKETEKQAIKLIEELEKKHKI